MREHELTETTGNELADQNLNWVRRSRFLQTLRELVGVRLAKFGLAVLGIAVIAAVFSPLLAVHDPIKINPRDSLQDPSAEYWLGADRLGRDQLARLIYGARVSLIIGGAGVGIAVVAGIAIGTVSGWAGKWTDEILMRIMDALAAFPNIVFALVLVAITGGAMRNIILVIGLVFTPAVARLIRAQVLSVKERDYVIAAIALGASPVRIISSHLIPNSLAPVIVQASIAFGAAILLEASLSFLGVGVKPPTPTWGGMLRHAFEVVDLAPWLTFTPGATIFLVVLAFNFVGDALRDTLDPRLRGAR
ncbi:MAG: ABC transporter permease [Chloroflexi bacterium]|nr:ABC transporter permease [Chloroflexota bacterium]